MSLALNTPVSLTQTWVDAFLKETTLFSLARLYDSNIEDLGHE